MATGERGKLYLTNAVDLLLIRQMCAALRS